MLISSKRAPIANNRISLSPWLRAPLFLSRGTVYYSVMESQPENRKYIELITSAIDVDHWSDLWRIEFETEDKPGNAALLLNLLVDRNLLVLNMESSVDAIFERHATSVLVSARGYESARDLSHSERSNRTSFELKELQEDLLIYFWDQFAIDADGHPRLKIRQMHTYRQLQAAIAAGKRFVLNRDGQSLDGDAIELSDRAMKRLRGNFRTDNLLAAPTVDTKERLIRTTIFSADRSRLFHFQIAYAHDNQEFLRWIYAQLFEVDANVVKSQLRGCPADRLKTLGAKAPDARFNTVDITFEMVAESSDQRLAEFDASIARKLNEEKSAGLIVERSWA